MFAKAPFSIVIFSVWFSFYGGLLHFVYYYFTETKCYTALFACIFLSFLFNPSSASPLVEDRFCFISSTDGIIQKCTSLYIFELRVFQWKNSLLLNAPDILSITSLTFRQTRYQALDKNVQCLQVDFRSSRCPKRTSCICNQSPPYRRNWLWWKNLYML